MCILFTEPLAFILHCFQALLEIVLIRHAAVHCYKLREDLIRGTKRIKRPILRPQLESI